jgi:hypothetical protein
MRNALSLALAGNHVEAAVTAYWTLGATANDWGDYVGARSVFDEAVVYCRANELGTDEEFCLGCLVVVARNAGEWTSAERLARDLLDRPSLPEASRAHALLTLGLIAAARGATKRARRLLDQANVLAAELGLAQNKHECGFGVALVDELEGTATTRWPELVDAPIAQMCSGRAISSATV